MNIILEKESRRDNFVLSKYSFILFFHEDLNKNVKIEKKEITPAESLFLFEKLK